MNMLISLLSLIIYIQISSVYGVFQWKNTNLDDESLFNGRNQFKCLNLKNVYRVFTFANASKYTVFIVRHGTDDDNQANGHGQGPTSTKKQSKFSESYWIYDQRLQEYVHADWLYSLDPYGNQRQLFGILWHRQSVYNDMNDSEIKERLIVLNVLHRLNTQEHHDWITTDNEDYLNYDDPFGDSHNGYLFYQHLYEFNDESLNDTDPISMNLDDNLIFLNKSKVVRLLLSINDEHEMIYQPTILDKLYSYRNSNRFDDNSHGDNKDEHQNKRWRPKFSVTMNEPLSNRKYYDQYDFALNGVFKHNNSYYLYTNYENIYPVRREDNFLLSPQWGKPLNRFNFEQFFPCYGPTVIEQNQNFKTLVLIFGQIITILLLIIMNIYMMNRLFRRKNAGIIRNLRIESDTFSMSNTRTIDDPSTTTTTTTTATNNQKPKMLRTNHNKYNKRIVRNDPYGNSNRYKLRPK